MALTSQQIFLFSGGLFRRLASCGFVVMLVLQILFPSLGKAESSGRWIEICSEFGIVEVQVPLEDQGNPDGECPDCETCLMCLTDNGQTRATPAPSSTLVIATKDARIMRPSPDVSNPAQFWHDGRGPPRRATNDMKRACGASMASTLSKEVASWT